MTMFNSKLLVYQRVWILIKYDNVHVVDDNDLDRV